MSGPPAQGATDYVAQLWAAVNLAAHHADQAEQAAAESPAVPAAAAPRPPAPAP